VAYGKNVPIERVVVEQLISGAEETGYYRTLPAKLKLLGISVNNGTCYVNLDSTFLSEMVNVSESIPIYSIVNSLCQLESINQVQILVNGDSSKMYRESLPLSETYKFNDDIVQQ
jgi:germination protein M